MNLKKCITNLIDSHVNSKVLVKNNIRDKKKAIKESLPAFALNQSTNLE
jgi:hypothetical protein